MPDLDRRDWLRRVAYGAVLLWAPGRRPLPQTPRAPSYRYVHLDVFTDRPLAGNQLLVYLDPAGLDADAMTRLTLESNYSENTFVFPPAQPGTDVRGAVRAHDPALAARLAAGEAYVTDGRGIELAADAGLADGSILRVVVSARRGVEESDADA